MIFRKSKIKGLKTQLDRSSAPKQNLEYSKSILEVKTVSK